MATTPPGWYDDGRGALRWWDGRQWTEHVQTPDAEISVADQTIVPDTASGFPALFEQSKDSGDGAEPAGEYPPSAPPGYPGGFPGGPTPSGGFIAATEPKKSKLWIVWVIVGVLLLGIVILATVLIPILIGMFGGGASSGAGTGAGSDDEAAAVAAVQLYDEAWATADCDKFQASTTETFREIIQLTDCASFTAAAQSFTDSVDDYQLAVVSVETGEDQITVSTSETFTSMVDDNGNPLDEPAAFEESYSYIVVPEGDGWAIGDANAN